MPSKATTLAAMLLAGAATLLASHAYAAGTLKIAREQDGSTFDPIKTILNSDIWVMDNMNANLVRVTKDGVGLEPDLAEKWTLAPDNVTYTFNLRDGLKFSDGSPLKASDVKFSLERLRDTKDSVMGSMYKIIAKIDAPDDKTVVITTDKPSAPLLSTLAMFAAAIVPESVVKAEGDDFGTKPVGAGAFMLKNWAHGDKVELVKNPNYWDAANVKIDKVVYQITEDDKTAVKLFKAGSLDITVDLPSDQIEPLKKELGDEVHVSPYLQTDYISFNIKKPPFDNEKIRQALSTAIDRDTLINKVVKGGYVVNCGYVIPLSDYPAPKVPECDMNKIERLAKAKALLVAGMAEAKVTKLSVTIESTDNETEKKLAEAVALMWKKALGINAKVNAQEHDAWLDAFNAMKWDAFNDDLVGDFAGPESFLSYIDPRGGVYGWESQQYQDLWDKAMLAADKTQRYALLAQAEKLFLDQYIAAPVAAVPNRELVRKTITGWVDNVGASHPTRFMTISGN